jgi:hypothetical protein
LPARSARHGGGWKAPNFSPGRTLGEVRRHALSLPAEEYLAIKGLPADWTAQFIRDEAILQIDWAEQYVMSAPVKTIGLLVVDQNGIPIQVTDETLDAAILRRATEEPEVMPAPADFDVSAWSGKRP